MPLTAEQRVARAREAVRTRWRGRAHGRGRKWIGREDERDALISKAPGSVASIAKEFGLTRQRVYQILERLGVRPPAAA